MFTDGVSTEFRLGVTGDPDSVRADELKRLIDLQNRLADTDIFHPRLRRAKKPKKPRKRNGVWVIPGMPILNETEANTTESKQSQSATPTTLNVPFLYTHHAFTFYYSQNRASNFKFYRVALNKTADNLFGS